MGKLKKFELSIKCGESIRRRLIKRNIACANMFVTAIDGEEIKFWYNQPNGGTRSVMLIAWNHIVAHYDLNFIYNAVLDIDREWIKINKIV